MGLPSKSKGKVALISTRQPTRQQYCKIRRQSEGNEKTKKILFYLPNLKAEKHKGLLNFKYFFCRSQKLLMLGSKGPSKIGRL